MVELKDCKLWCVTVNSDEEFMTIATTRNAAKRNVKRMIRDWGRNWDDCDFTHIDYYELTVNNTMVLG